MKTAEKVRKAMGVEALTKGQELVLNDAPELVQGFHEPCSNAEFAELLERVCDKYGMTQADAARLFGYDPAQFTRYKKPAPNGRTYPVPAFIAFAMRQISG